MRIPATCGLQVYKQSGHSLRPSRQLPPVIAHVPAMNHPEPIVPTLAASKRPARTVGLLLGLAAAAPGLISPVSGIPLRPWHAFVLLALSLAVLVRARAVRSSLPRLPFLDASVVLLTLVTAMVEALNASYLNYAPDFMFVIRPMIWLAIYWAARLSIHSLEDARRLLTWFALPAVPSVALGLAQIMGIDAAQQLIVRLSPDSGGFISRLEDGRLIRATALVQHWTSFGSYLCTIVAASMALLGLARVHKIGREWVAWTLLGVAGFGVLTTLTLAPIVTAFFIFLGGLRTARAVARAAPMILLVGLVAAVSLGALFAERLEQQFATSRVAASSGEGSWMPSTLAYRYNIWITETIPMIKDRPATGWGSSVYEAALSTQDPRRTYPYQMDWASPESQWFNLLMTFGVIGFAAFLLMFMMMAATIRRAAVAGSQWISKPTLLLFLLMLVSAFTAPVFTNHGLPVGLWTLLAVAAAFTARRTPSDGSSTKAVS